MNAVYLQESISGQILRGVAFLPETGVLKEFPTVVLHHGFGANRIEAGGLFVHLSRALNDEGYATVAFDRSGHGESDGDFFDTTVSNDVRDSIALLEAIARLPFVDPENLNLLGMSMGGVVASIVAADTTRAVRSLTLWSPAAVFVDDAIANDMGGRHPMDELADRGWYDNGGVRLGPAFFAEARTFDVYGRAAPFTGPVLVMSGDADVVVPVRYPLGYRDVYGDAARVSIVPGADHVWSSAPVRELLIQESVAFVTSDRDQMPASR